MLSNKIPICDTIPKSSKKYKSKLNCKWVEPDTIAHQDANIIHEDLGNTLTKSNAIIKPNPAFHRVYNDKDKDLFMSLLKMDSHLSRDLKNRIIDFVKTYWDIFHPDGVKIPIQGYEMEINTGTHKPISISKVRYGMHEAPLMQKTIDKLLELNHIVPDNTSPWGFKITLAPKPHQEDVTDIDEFEWRFCVNYILLNMITRPVQFPIPRCDDAVLYGLGAAIFYVLWDAFSGYHQVKLSRWSMPKTAFFAPHGRKYMYIVMPFGLKNAPAIFTAMMYDLRAEWTQLCQEKGISASNDNGSTIIIDDTFVWAINEDQMFDILHCIAKVSRKYHLTWKLKKCRWFPKEVEFVGVDLSIEGNRPAKSKTSLLQRWKYPTTARQIMSFIGFAIFYLRWLPYFEFKVAPLRQIIREASNLDEKFKPGMFQQLHKNIFDAIRSSILDRPILQRADRNKRFYLKTDFSAIGIGFALCQPSNDEESIKAMNQEIKGEECKFEESLNGLRLLPIVFGSRKTVGNEKHFHSYPGECLAAVWAIGKNRHFLWGKPFTLITDCSALMWLIKYDGNNHAVKRLQLELLGYSFTIVHRSNKMLEDANYFSRVDCDIDMDPLLHSYIKLSHKMRDEFPPDPNELSANNMPGRRKVKTNICQIDKFSTRQCINMPVNIEAINEINSKPSHLYNAFLASAAMELRTHSWAVYNPRVCQFMQSVTENGVNFDVIMAIESDQTCRNHLQHINVPIIKSTIVEMNTHLANIISKPNIKGMYFAFDHDSEFKVLWDQKMQLCETLIQKYGTQIIVFQYPSSISTNSIRKLKKKLQEINMNTHIEDINFTDFNDSIDNSICLVIAWNPDFNQDIKIRMIKPPKLSRSFSQFIVPTFNMVRYAIPNVQQLFNIRQGTTDGMSEQCRAKYVLTPKNKDFLNNAAIPIYDQDCPAPIPTDKEQPIFGHLFGIDFSIVTSNDTDETLNVRPISTFEYISIFGYDHEFNHRIAKDDCNLRFMKSTIPANTQRTIIEMLSSILESTQQKRVEAQTIRYGVNFERSVFLNGLVRDNLPTHLSWQRAYDVDKDCNLMILMVQNKHLITKKNLEKLHHIFRSPMRKSQIVYEDEKLILKEPIVNSNKVLRLIIVPEDLRHHIFLAFHVNPLGGHYSSYYTVHRIRLRYFWPGMVSYVEDKISKCASCILKQGGNSIKKELLYSFPSTAPMNCVHADVYSAGSTTSIQGYIALMIVMCHMTGFVMIEPIKESTSEEFARAFYVCMLRYGLSHMVVTDADSKFKYIFRQMVTILKIQHHDVSKGNHDAIIVERFNRFLNSSLKVFTNERDTTRVFVEGSLLAAYAWNSAPVIGTNISRSLIVVGREFQFPIDIESNNFNVHNIHEDTVLNYAQTQLELLQKCQEIYCILIEEHRSYHREYRNSQIQESTMFKIDDIVFASVQVQSRKEKGKVKKLLYVKRGPYRVSKVFGSGSYELTPLKGGKLVKKHGSSITMCPKEIDPYRPLSTSDLQFANLNKKLSKDRFQHAHIKDDDKSVFPWHAKAQYSDIIIQDFPTVKDLDDEIDGWPPQDHLTHEDLFDSDTTTIKQKENVALISVNMDLATKIKQIIESEDRLFFISQKLPNQQRREWRLVQINLKESLRQHHTCLQDGKFLFQYYILHQEDHRQNPMNQRYWIQYHKKETHKTMSKSYKIVQPTDFSHQQQLKESYIPFTQWYNIMDSNSIIHGPFNFRVRNSRKTRDQVDKEDWIALASGSDKYDNDSPKLDKNKEIFITFNEKSEYTCKRQEISAQVDISMSTLFWNDEILPLFQVD